ncbi:MAG TPA: ArsA-related P-loop ATPase [Acidimicrobiia bacterium]|nr:ArsA-related P-loop ATPase [Acidimicrobiia bacterium]
MLERRLLIVTGKGGVGKSAIAVAAALHAAKHGQRVLVVGMADGVGLAAHLRVGRLGSEPTRIRPGLHALAIDPAAALDEYLRLRIKVPRLGMMTRAFGVLADTVPGIRDTVVIGKVLYEATRLEWDIVVADAPATGQILSYLRAPATIETLVPGGRVREQAAWMREVLGDPTSTGILIAATPEELPVAETRETLDAIASEGLADVAGVVANRVVPPLAISADRITREPPGPRRDAAMLHRDVRSAQETHLAALQPAVTFPLLFGLRTPGEVASRLSEMWDGE